MKTKTKKDGAVAVGCGGGFGWIACADRMPTADDANEWNEVWWWIPRFAANGPQRDYWDQGEGATHWTHSDGYEEDGEQPDPPALPNAGDVPRAAKKD